MLRDPAGDALPDMADELLQRLVLVLVEDLAAEGDRQQREAVLLHHVDAAVVVVEDRVELFGDRGGDLVDVVEAGEGRRHAVQHVQLRDESKVRRLGGSRMGLLASRHGPEPP